MKHKLLGKLSAALVVVAVSTCTVRLKPVSEKSLSVPYTSTTAACRSEIDLNTAINKKLSSEDWAEADQTKKMLLNYSNESSVCRTEIINVLIQAMNKPHLSFVADRRDYFLWLNGSAIFGELKAVEALDLLIDHLDLNDGAFSASMVHQPAVLGVKAMGVVAVPKLSLALQQNANRNIRLAAALCLAEIGGPDGMNALEHALRSESNPCVSRFIRIAIEISNNERKTKVHPSNQSDTDAQIDLRRQLLMAFRCNN